MKLATIVASVLLMTGCASGSKFQDTTFTEAEPDNTRVFFYRPGRYLGAALRPSVFIDGENIGEIQARGFFFKDLKPGNYTVSVGKETGKYITEISTFNEDVVYIKVEMRSGAFVYHPQPVRVPEEVGSEEIKKTKFQN